MLGTYNYMALGVAGTAAVVMLLMANPQVMQAIALGPMKWVRVCGCAWTWLVCAAAFLLRQRSDGSRRPIGSTARFGAP